MRKKGKERKEGGIADRWGKRKSGCAAKLYFSVSANSAPSKIAERVALKNEISFFFSLSLSSSRHLFSPSLFPYRSFSPGG